jgi:peptidyl-prolyl cis-trans isomerase SurA
MDRRIVAGLICWLLVPLVGGKASAQTAPPATRDPGAPLGVGMVPLRSINDSINDVSITNPNVVPMASSRVPTSPVGTGPAAAIPASPVLTEPVSMTPLDPLHHSLSHGFAPGRIASLFRRPGARPTSPASTTTVRYLPSLGASTAPPPTLSRLPQLPPASPGSASAAPTGRSSPYAGQAPETARQQADPVVVPASATGPGRPSPYVNQIPPNARPQAPNDNRPAAPRPRLDPSIPAEIPGALPVVPTELPAATLPDSMPTQSSNSMAPAISPVGAIGPVPSALPILDSTEQAAPAPVVGNFKPPEVLPDLATIEAEPKPLAPVPQPPSVADSKIVDNQVKRTSAEATRARPLDEAALQIKDSSLKRKEDFLTFSAATVGDEVITINELQEAVKIQMAEYPEVRNLPKGSVELNQAMNHIAGFTLTHLIEQRLILLEAKAKMRGSKGKNEERLNEFIETIWKAEELPALFHENSVNNVHELKIKMREKGQNYESKKEIFRKREMAKNFLNMEIRNHVTHDMIELREYYEIHKNDYIKPARITWREIEVNIGRYPDRATARKKADELLARLLHNESFETIAKKFSNGPTASQGGVYIDMQPGGYGIAIVNNELNRLPIGQVSQVIEAPNSFHIVRVDSRREKGPLRFDEIQQQVNEQVILKNYQKAVTEYLARLRAKTYVRSMFENTSEGLVEKRPGQAASPPNLSKADPAVQPAANR